jgi:phosphoribosylanthranilate isomerase
MKLKVCGMREAQNIESLIEIEPDFIGFIFHEKSPRNVISKPQIAIPKSSKLVGVFVNQNEHFIRQKVDEFDLDFLQLHGTESPEFCQKMQKSGFRIIKAFNIHADFDFEILKKYVPYCEYFLFDAFGKNAGGNGITFNWDLLENYQEKKPFLLSGGIDETMAKQIKEFKHEFFAGIDINSKFESSPAFKNIEKIKQFKNDF